MRANTALVGKKAYHGYDSFGSGEGTSKPKKSTKRQVQDGSDGDSGGEEKRSSDLLTIDVFPTDTLQSLALQYRCPVNDIKRVNALITELDLYAHKTIRIPIQKYSFLSERGPRKRTLSREENGTSSGYTGASQFSTTSFTTKDVFEENLSHREFSSEEENAASAPFLPISKPESITSRDTSQKTQENVGNDFRLQAAEKNDVTSYLKNLDKDIRKTVKKADLKSGNETLDELTSSIQDYSTSLPTIQRRPLRQQDTMNGADCGFKWWSVILCFFLILLFILLLALMEYYYNSK